MAKPTRKENNISSTASLQRLVISPSIERTDREVENVGWVER